MIRYEKKHITVAATLTFLGSRERQQKSKQDELNVAYFRVTLSSIFSLSGLFSRVYLHLSRAGAATV